MPIRTPFPGHPSAPLAVLLGVVLGVLLAPVGCTYETSDIFGDDDDAADDDAADDDDGANDDDDGADDDDTANDDDDAGDDDTANDDDTAPSDGDGDGWPEWEDCDDSDPTVHPGASEDCDGVDDDCDGAIDEGLLTPHFTDADGDGFGDPATEGADCEVPDGRVLVGGDCDDSDPAVHPGSTAQVDGQDSDCDGRKDWLVTLYISGDDVFEFCIDDENAILGGGGNWTTGFVFEEWLPSGPHVVGIQGWDTGQVITAMIAHITISDGTTWLSDATWTFDPSPTSDADLRAGWCAPGFDDSSWQAANEIGPIGTAPWGNAPSVFPSGSAALWIWDYYPVDLNTQFLRKQIELPW